MMRSVIITAQGFQDEEYIYPFYRLAEAGFHVDVATKDDAPAKGKYGLTAKPSITMNQLDAARFDLVVLPGGHEAPDRVRQIPEVLSFVRAMNDSKKIISSICHGPWIMISARIVRGRKLTAYAAIRDDLENAGAIYVDAPVVVDGNFVTSPHYNNNGDWMRATLNLCGVLQI